ncbi:MAG: isoleucine--tRNA ligase [Candidatus Aenigmarchaeota archaeon]|nr:isoleucine--tRNA ligase [Candidatus Aenigmarchaeota archaeon]
MGGFAAYDPKAIERGVREFWARERVPAQAAALGKGKKFYLLDGPPYVNYVPHVGHVKTTTLKDVWGKFKRMQGHAVWFQPGFDCNGLPIEHAVEKELGIQSKRDIETMGVAAFIGKCRELAEKNKPLWMDTYRLLGAWRGWVEPYLTYTNDYLESGWWAVQRMAEKGLLVEGERSGFWCTHCETVLAGYETTDSYKNVDDPSVYVKFPVQGEEKTFLLVWTTTPWTLPSNVAIAVLPEELYARVQAGDEILILAQKRLRVLEELGVRHQPLGTFPGKELEGVRYRAAVDTPLQRELDGSHHQVIPSIKLLKKRAASKTGSGEDVFEDFVAMDAGTGLVHTAPGLGDAKVGEHFNLPSPSPIDERGCFTAEAGRYQGLYVKKADQAIIQDLQQAGLLLHAGRTTHAYPLCWRCKTPLIYRKSRQWYVPLEGLRPRLLKALKEVAWLPAFAGERFREVVETAPDWAVTRQRYWGIPLPVWVCGSCGSRKIIGSKDELRQHATRPLPQELDLHKDAVDAIRLQCHCGKEMARVPDIMDVWFDSGISPWASLGYPFRNKELFQKLWPVDLVDESQDQIRGYFYTLMVCSQAVFGRAPYKTVCLNGWTLDEKGEKMSKSAGNVVWASAGLQELGADLLRLYSCQDTAPWDTQKFSLRNAKDAERVLSVLWNAALFTRTYGGKGSLRTLRPEDEWLLSRTATVVRQVTAHLESFSFHLAARALADFILNDLSRWYIKLVRDRVSPFSKDKSRKAAQACLAYSLDRVVRLLAPFCPFLAERLWLDSGREGSVHLAAWPAPEQKRQQPQLEEGMRAVQELMEAVHALRAERKLNLRWPVDQIAVQVGTDLSPLEGVIRELGNAKRVVFQPTLQGGKEFARGRVDIGRVLEDEALLREVIRQAQALRKEKGLAVEEQIDLSLHADPAVKAALTPFVKAIQQGTGARKVRWGAGPELGAAEFQGRRVGIGM